MDKKQDSRPAAAKNAAAWERMIKTELFQHPTEHYARRGRRHNSKKTKKPIPDQKYRWDPYNRFAKKEDVNNFFSGHAYRRYNFIDRERYAKFAIAKTLKSHTDDNFKTAGEFMKHELIAHGSDEPEASHSLERAIRETEQQDVDVEVPRDHTADASKARGNETTQSVSAAAQSVIAASPNSLGPPVDPCATYLKMTKCGVYGRTASTVWRSPLIPNLDNEDGRRGLLDHQITAIVWILSRMFGDLPTLRPRKIHSNIVNLFDEDRDTGKSHSNIMNSFDEKNRDRLKGPRYFGGILADSMGLGKTLTTVALVDLLISQGLIVKRAKDGTPRYHPILLITPNATVANQWVQEFCQTTTTSTVRLIAVSGPGLEGPFSDNRVIHIPREEFKAWRASLKYMWDAMNPEASHCVLIMTMESWASRTCIQVQKKEWSSTFAEAKRGFSLVIVDEAYKVKNPATKNWRSIYFLERQFTLLITATPCMNTLADLLGLARLLWTGPEKYLAKKPKLAKEIDDTFKKLEDLKVLDGFRPSHKFYLAAGRPGLLTKMLSKPRNARTQDIGITRKYLKYFETLAMLKRSPSSYLYSDWEKTKPIPLEGLFPKVENYTVDIHVGAAYNREYQKVHIDLLIDYLQGLKDWDDDFYEKRAKKKAKTKIKKEEDEEEKEPIRRSLRRLLVASASLDVHDLDTIITANGHSTLAPKVAEMREKEVDLLRLAQFLVLPDEDWPKTHVGWLELVCRNSPILRYILHYINQNILTRQETGPIKKLLIIEENNMLAFYYELVLQFLGFECRCMHAHLSLEERQQLVDSFNSSDPGSCQILIQLYTVGFTGTNLHKNCSRVLVASQSHSLPVQSQAIHRVIRVGQSSDVTVHRVKLKNSFHSFRESRQIEKILPELGARAQGNTKKVLVRLLNLFQYEIRQAWDSPEGQELLKEKKLVDDDDDEADADEAPALKKIRLEDGTQIKVERPETKEGEISFLRKIPAWSNNNNNNKPYPVAPRPGNGADGWFNDEPTAKNDTDAFLERRTRDAYYAEFIDLKRRAKGLFNHAKNNLRRLLSYGHDKNNNNNGGDGDGDGDGDGGGRELLSTDRDPWTEADLEDPAILERALELMLRVRLGADDVAMLPFPLIDVSGADPARRRRLQRLLADARHTDQDLDRTAAAAAVAGQSGGNNNNNNNKDLRESMRGGGADADADAEKRPVAQIEKDLEDQARFGDLGSRRAAGAGAGTAGGFKGEAVAVVGGGDNDSEGGEAEEVGGERGYE